MKAVNSLLLSSAVCSLMLKGSRSPHPPKNCPLKTGLPRRTMASYPFPYLQTEFPSFRRRTGEREKVIDDASVFISAGHEEVIDDDKGEHLQRDEVAHC